MEVFQGVVGLGACDPDRAPSAETVLPVCPGCNGARTCLEGGNKVSGAQWVILCLSMYIGLGQY